MPKRPRSTELVIPGTQRTTLKPRKAARTGDLPQLDVVITDAPANKKPRKKRTARVTALSTLKAGLKKKKKDLKLAIRASKKELTQVSRELKSLGPKKRKVNIGALQIQESR